MSETQMQIDIANESENANKKIEGDLLSFLCNLILLKLFLSWREMKSKETKFIKDQLYH